MLYNDTRTPHTLSIIYFNAGKVSELDKDRRKYPGMGIPVDLGAY